MIHSIKNRVKQLIYDYRYDMVGLLTIIVVTGWMFSFFFKEGTIIFSDIDFPYDSRDYLNQIIGVYNHRFNTTAMLNTPRLLSILPAFCLSALFGFSGGVFLKTFIFQCLLLSSFGFYLFAKRLLRIYYNPIFDLQRIILITAGALYYALNPWVMMRIQHIYLLVGYSLFPYVLLQFFKIFDHKFQMVSIERFDPLSGRVYRRNIIDAILLGLAISVSAGAIHYFFYTALLLSALLALIMLKYAIKYREYGIKGIWRIYWGMIKRGIFLCIFILGFSAYWFIVYVASIVFGTEATQNNVNVLDTYTAFSRNSSLINVLYLNSYWWTMIEMNFLSVAYWVAGGVIITFSGIGVIFSFKRINIVLFMGMLGTVLALLATGVYYLPIAPWFLMFVNMPVIGSLFRDPNKLVGILSLCMGIAFVFGADVMLEGINALKLKALGWIVCCVVMVTTLTYVFEIRDPYVAYFYDSVPEPASYEALKENLDDGYTIYLPLAEEMLQQSRIATPYWNSTGEAVEKSTGDVHIYNTTVDTLFQHEGNDPVVAYYLRYIQFLVDEHRTDDTGYYVHSLGSNRLIYHDEYLEQEARQDDNKAVIGLDEAYHKTYENDIFTVYESDFDLSNLPSGIIYETNGMESLSVLEQSDGYDPLAYPLIYAYQSFDGSEIFNESVQTYIDASNLLDLKMSFISEDYVIYPFDAINEGNPYLKWSKTYLTSTDWSWYLSSRGYTDRDFDFDSNGGVAVAFSSAQLDILPYERKLLNGQLVMDFDDMLAEELFFVPDNKEIFDVIANPYNGGMPIQAVHGILSKGDPLDIWQVAKSGLIPVQASMPYAYDLLISGRNLSSFHLKARFYNRDMEEVGIAYIVAPEASTTYDTIHFEGEVISDDEAVYMRLDILSYQEPISKSYWWIHDIHIYEIPDYVAPNTISMTTEATEGMNHLLVRTFMSQEGDWLSLKVGENEYEWNTYDDNAGFEWVDLGVISIISGATEVSLTSKGGFQAVNAIAIVPVEEFEAVESSMASAVAKSSMMASAEGVLTLEGDYQLQSERTYSQLSYGKGIDLSRGQLSWPIHIFKEDDYRLDISSIFPMGVGNIQYTLGSYKGEIIPSDEEVIELHLEAGDYNLSLMVDGDVYNYISIYDLEPMVATEDFVTKAIDDPFMVDCSECEKVSAEMMRHVIEDDMLIIDYDQTCSCDWYIYTSKPVKVVPEDEWYVTFEAVSTDLVKRHGKVIFNDTNGNFIGYQFINEVEEAYKSQWHTYEQIVEVPENAASLYLQFWGRGSKEGPSSLSVKKLVVNRYKDFITIDHILLTSTDIDFGASTSRGDASNIVKKEGTWQFEATEGLLNTYMSPNVFFQNAQGGRAYKLNGVTMGFVFSENEKAVISAPLFKAYMIGFVITVVFLIGSYLYIYRRKGRR